MRGSVPVGDRGRFGDRRPRHGDRPFVRAGPADLEEGEDNAVMATTKNIYDQLKKRSVVKSGEKIDPSTGEITSMTNNKKTETLEGAAALRSMLKMKK